jgi:hypothetical protein
VTGRHTGPRVAVAAGLGTAAAGYLGYLGLITGRVSLDLDLGRRTRPLGPLVVDIAASREDVYAAATAPYAERQPRALAEKVVILDRTDHMVLAAHRTPVGNKLTAVTVETVTFDPPHRIGFRLVRGPVPLVTETFDLQPASTGRDTGTRLTYTGTLGTDLGWLGERWGDLVARSWIHAVEDSLAAIKDESERRNGVQ